MISKFLFLEIKDIYNSLYFYLNYSLTLLAVVKPHPGRPPLNLDSTLLDKNRDAVGQIFEVFGPVIEPLYSIRFNSEEEAIKLPIGMELFYAPGMDELTKKIFTQDLIT